MSAREITSFRQRQQGGITIVVVLMLLVLVMVAAFGMSRDALRELGITGTSRQGAQLFNETDTGINWAVFWMSPSNQALSAATTAGAALKPVYNTLSTHTEYLGVATSFPATGEMITTGTNSVSQFDLTITRVGTAPTDGTSQNVNAALIAPILWIVRSDGSIKYNGTSTTFKHAREAWITVPRSPAS